MRNVARDVSALYVEQRQAQDYPLLHRGSEEGQSEEVRAQHGEVMPASDRPQPFVFEIGSEELPAADITAALTQLRAAVPALLTELRLNYDTVEVHGTPRRLVIFVPQLAGRQSDLETMVKGPPANRAFDET